MLTPPPAPANLPANPMNPKNSTNPKNSKNVIVTGCAGFIGSHLVDLLLAEGWHVLGIDNFDPFYDSHIKHHNLTSALQNPCFTLIEADIRDLPSLKKALSAHSSPLTPHTSPLTPHTSPLTPHAVVHLAAKAGVRPSLEDPTGYYQTNVLGTQNLLQLARQWGVTQFVFASSSSVYGVNPHVPWHEDDHVLRPVSPYGATKVAGELLGHVYSHIYGIRFLGLRLFTVYGPRQRPDLAIHKFARLMRQGKPIPIYGDGSTSRDYTYVDDIVRGIRAAMDYRSSSYEIINLGNNSTVRLLDMVRSLEEAQGVKAALEYLPPQPGDVPHTWADISKARELLGWQPHTPFAQGLARFADWLTDL